MKFKVIWFLAKYIYKEVLRGLLLKAINDPNSEWDDHVIDLCDRIFDWEE